MSGLGYELRFKHSACTISSISSVVMPGRMAAAAMSRTSREYCERVRGVSDERWGEEGERREEREGTHPAHDAHPLDLLGVEHPTRALVDERLALRERDAVLVVGVVGPDDVRRHLALGHRLLGVDGAQRARVLVHLDRLPRVVGCA